MLEYRRTLQAAEDASHSEYDKAVIALSGGALGITFAFLKEIVARTGTADLLWLMVAWIMWALSLASILGSFYTAGKANRRAIQQLDANEFPDAPGGAWDRATRTLNFIGGLGFVLGVICAICFVYHALLGYEPTKLPASQATARATSTASPAATP
jgi:hypothetical protein